MIARTNHGMRLLLCILSAGALGCSDPVTGTPLAIIQVQGTVTSTADGAPISGVDVTLVYAITGGSGAFGRGSSDPATTDAQGRFAVSMEDVQCSPGTFDLGISVPTGFQAPTNAPPMTPLECTEAVQTRDLQLEPTP